MSEDASLATDDVDPNPTTRIAPCTIPAIRHDRHDDSNHRKEASAEDPRHRLRHPLPLADLEAPQHTPELTVSDQGHEEPMRRERQIVEPHRRPRAEGIAGRIFLPDERREQKGRGRDGVACKAEDVDGGKVDRETVRGTPVVVEDGLRVEGGRPAQEAVDIRSPSARAGMPNVLRGQTY